MSRTRKLLTVGLILGFGFGLAWPFRKTGDQAAAPSLPHDQQAGNVFATTPSSSIQSSGMSPTSNPPARHVVAKMASTSERAVAISGSASFDLANHPVTPTAPLRVAKPSARSVYSTVNQESAREPEDAWSEEVLHIVRNTDTLEKLAERYLGDGGRALEIFDLNRDQLDNPHLLPIGAKLRIPVDAARMVN